METLIQSDRAGHEPGCGPREVINTKAATTPRPNRRHRRRAVVEFFDFLRAPDPCCPQVRARDPDHALFRTLDHAGLRSEETSLLDRPDVHFDRGPFGKLHVRCGKVARTSGPRPRWVPMLDGLDLVLRRLLGDVRGRFPGSPVLFADESGGHPHRGTIRNRLRHLTELEGRPAMDGPARMRSAGPAPQP